ncbi:hypothetical protein Dimus_012136 [Dionaea muscipula]
MISSSSMTFDHSTQKLRVSFSAKSIDTTVTDNAAVVDQWVREVQSMYGSAANTVVGLDIEWSNHDLLMSNKTATLQLCVDTRCLIVQLLYMDHIPQSLKSFCWSPNFIFVGFDMADDVARLRDDYELLFLWTKDVKAEAMYRWPSRFRRPGLKDLAWEVAGLHMEKPKTLSMRNWENRVLTEQQIECNLELEARMQQRTMPDL